jgi:hypothetical protein
VCPWESPAVVTPACCPGWPDGGHRRAAPPVGRDDEAARALLCERLGPGRRPGGRRPRAGAAARPRAPVSGLPSVPVAGADRRPVGGAPGHCLPARARGRWAPR